TVALSPTPVATPTPAPTTAPTPTPAPTTTPAPAPTPTVVANSGSGGSQHMLPESVKLPTGSATQSAALDRDALLTQRHGNLCVSTNVLSIRLVTKKRTKLARAIFWIDGKRVRTVKGKKLYVSTKTKKRVLRVQKFKKLPAVKFVFKANVRTTGGKTFKLRQVYYRCTPPKKAAKSLPVR
ncbi:MAG: hypothetical protein J7513_01370, partial [Solirubrobacteraceae bacterium]|nr:hypothetical protein [Solirubrobacteraceae bacterium]